MNCPKHPQQKLIQLFTSAVCDICEEESKADFNTRGTKQAISSGNLTIAPASTGVPPSHPLALMAPKKSPRGLTYSQYYCYECYLTGILMEISYIFPDSKFWLGLCSNNVNHSSRVANSHVRINDYYGVKKGHLTHIHMYKGSSIFSLVESF